MNDDRTESEKYTAWVNAVTYCWTFRWKCLSGWLFESPSGSIHDLSAADLTKLSEIENDGLFVASKPITLPDHVFDLFAKSIDNAAAPNQELKDALESTRWPRI